MPRIIALIMFAALATPVLPQAPTPLKEEIKKASTFTSQERLVLRNLRTLPPAKLTDLLNVYERLSNAAMTQVVAQELLRRDPKNTDARQALTDDSPSVEVRPANYLDTVSRRVLGGQPAPDPEAVAIRARLHLQEQENAQAVTLLEALKRVNFASKPFPFMEDLAEAYRASGRLDQAEAAYRSVIDSSASSAQAREDASRELGLIAEQRRILNGRALIAQDPTKAVDYAARMRREMPGSAAADEFYADALQKAGRNLEAARFLQQLKNASGGGAFRLQDDLADAWLAAKDYPRAREAYRELLKNPDTRAIAERGLRRTDMGELIEKGSLALKRGDTATGESVLKELQAKFPKEDDTLGYHATFLSKTKRSAEALQLLLAKKQSVASKGQAFSQQDDLADVYLDRKEYALARAAWQEVLDTPAYDFEMRLAAQKGLREVRKTELLDQGAVAIRDGHLRAARELSDQLRALGNDGETETFDAEITLMEGHARLAAQSLREIKAARYPDVPFPGQNALGTALHRSGDWQGAYDAFTEVLNSKGLDGDDYKGALWDRRELLPLLRNTLALDVDYLHEGEGTEWREHAAFTSEWWHDWRLLASAVETHASLSDISALGRGSFSRFEGTAGVQRKIGDYYAEADIGGTDNNILYTAKFGQFPNDRVGWSLAFYGNERATQSLSLEALNARQDRAEFQAGGSINERFRFDFRAYANWIRIGGADLGHGYGAEGSLEYIVQTETASRPEVSVGYFGSWNRFDDAGRLPPAVPELQVRRALASDAEVRQALPANYGSEVFNSLIEPQVNRHGVELAMAKKFDKSLSASLRGGIYYDFVYGQVEYMAAAGLQYWLTDSTMLYAELRYNSEGLAQSHGSKVIEAVIGAQSAF